VTSVGSVLGWYRRATVQCEQPFTSLLPLPQLIMSQLPLRCIRLCRGLLPQFAAALLTIAAANDAIAISCPAPSRTVGDLVSRSNVVALGKVLPQDRKSDPGTKTFVLVDVDRGPMTVYRGLKVTLQGDAGIAGQLFMLYGKAKGNEISWSGSTQITRAAYRFALDAPSPDAQPEVRLLYWFRFLGSGDERVAKDAFTEIGRIDFEHYRKVAGNVPREDLRRAFNDPVANIARRGLYAKLLGLCGDESDVKRLEDAMYKCMAPGKKQVAALDGIVAGYLLLEGAAGLELVEKDLLTPNEGISLYIPYAALTALEFVRSESEGTIPLDRLHAAARLVLKRRELADLAVVCLARWGDWTLHDELMVLFEVDDEPAKWIRPAIVRYMIKSLDVPPEVQADNPRRVRLGNKYLKEMWRLDPKAVKKVYTFFIQDHEFKAGENPNRKEQQTGRKSVEALRTLGAQVFLQKDKVIEVSANRTKISDDDLMHVAEFIDMTDLSLEETAVSAAGIAHLGKLQKLEWLNLYRTKVGDKGLSHLKDLKSLKLLPIGDAGITDAGLLHLRAMSQLEYLGLRGNNVTDMGLASLDKLVNLTGLYLGETKVTNAGIVHLEGMTKLDKLWLNGTAVSDAAIPSLSKLKSLRELYVFDTKLTAKGIATLRKSLPKCQITKRPIDD
jgi:hypothetical protein